MQRICGIDPGPYLSAYCLLVDGKPEDAGKTDNEDLLRLISLRLFGKCDYVIETIFPRGQAVGLETMDTQFWAGRYAQAAHFTSCHWQKIDRQDVRFAICGSLNTNDSNVRQGLIDHYGGDAAARRGQKCYVCKGRKEVGRGLNRGPCLTCDGSGWHIEPGPLKTFAKDMWAALAIALSVHLKHQLEVSA